MTQSPLICSVLRALAMKATMQSRRDFLIRSSSLAGVALLPASGFSLASDKPLASSMPFGDGSIFSLNDGQLQLPGDLATPDTLSAAERLDLLARSNVVNNEYKPDCNVVLWKTADRTVLFDTGAGSQFPVGGGELAASLEDAGIDPYDITDVVFTHAHPDHLWGVLDDFDDVAFPDAQFHIAQKEWDYWMDSNTLHRTRESRKTFVVGAQNRLPLIEEQINLFKGGDEILPGIEVVNTYGHTPGHSSFMLHSGVDSLLVVGDAIVNAALSFEYPAWESNSDQDGAIGVKTRLALLDRLAQDKSEIVGYHLPAPGVGYVERHGKAFRFIAK